MIARQKQGCACMIFWLRQAFELECHSPNRQFDPSLILLSPSIGVSTKPGATEFTRIPWSAQLRARPRVMVVIAPLPAL